jgi:hypothetical protein
MHLPPPRRRGLLALALLLPALRVRAATAPVRSIAVFGFTLTNTSPEPTTPEEAARLRLLDAQLADALAQSGRFRVIATTSLAARIENGPAIVACNGCELGWARELGASAACYGWVQKVSNLILNINVVLEDATNGRHLRQGSVDIRGNTDDSWRRGLRFLLEEHILTG